MSERIAYWADFDHPYVTWHNSYIETGWWIFKQLWDHGHGLPGLPRLRPTARAAGPRLSDHEVSLGYEDDTPDPSVFVKFRVPPSEFAKVPALAAVAAQSESTSRWSRGRRRRGRSPATSRWP